MRIVGIWIVDKKMEIELTKPSCYTNSSEKEHRTNNKSQGVIFKCKKYNGYDNYGIDNKGMHFIRKYFFFHSNEKVKCNHKKWHEESQFLHVLHK